MVLIAGVLTVQSRSASLVDERLSGIQQQAQIVASTLAEYTTSEETHSVDYDQAIPVMRQLLEPTRLRGRLYETTAIPEIRVQARTLAADIHDWLAAGAGQSTGQADPAPPTAWAQPRVAARLEILPTGQVKVMAPDITNAIGPREHIDELRARLAADLANGWSGVTPRTFEFDGKTFRKPGGIAPQMEWDKATNQMTLELYIGARPAMPVPLRPVEDFHDNPFGAG